ncbi:MAG: hypothetical protein ACI35O_06035 [Bacillaceae bacterium]
MKGLRIGRLLLVICVAVGALIAGVQLLPKIAKGVGASVTYETTHSYTSEWGIVFETDSDTWTEEKLKDLSEELFANKISSEIRILDKVVLLKEGKGNTLGESDISWYEPFKKVKKDAVIYLYNADKCESVEDFAYLLSHEYGHVYTYYWFLDKGIHPASENTDWAKIRKQETSQIKWKNDKKETIEDYRWSAQELLADEYVMVFGSPNAKKHFGRAATTRLSSPWNNQKLLDFWGTFGEENIQLQRIEIPRVDSVQVNQESSAILDISFVWESDSKRTNGYLVYRPKGETKAKAYFAKELKKGKNTIHIQKPNDNEEWEFQIVVFDSINYQFTYTPFHPLTS